MGIITLIIIYLVSITQKQENKIKILNLKHNMEVLTAYENPTKSKEIG